MSRGGRRLSDFAVPASLLVVFLVAAGSLVAAIKSVDVTALPGVKAVFQLASPSAQLSGPASAVAPGPLNVWALVLVLAVLLLVASYFVRRKGAASDRGAAWRTIGMALGIVFYFAFLEFLPELSSIVSGNFDVPFELATAASAAVMLVAAVAAMILFSERLRKAPTSPLTESGAAAKAVEKVLASVRARLYSKPEPGVLRDSVIECYSAMMMYLESRGAGDRPSYTPKELEAAAMEKVSASKRDVHLLTGLFEKARYATTPITAEDAQESLGALTRLTGLAAE
jgi:Domain of unknown function (DUF4129)